MNKQNVKKLPELTREQLESASGGGRQRLAPVPATAAQQGGQPPQVMHTPNASGGRESHA